MTYVYQWEERSLMKFYEEIGPSITFAPPHRFIHQSVVIGSGTVLGIGVVIEEGVEIGENCFIGHYCIIRPNSKLGYKSEMRPWSWLAQDVTVGNETVIYQYANICAGAVLKDKIYFGCKSICTNAKDIKVHHPDGNEWKNMPPVIESGVIISTDCQIAPGIHIGQNSIIDMGSLVTKDIPDNQVWRGRPARYLKDVDPKDRPIQ